MNGAVNNGSVETSFVTPEIVRITFGHPSSNSLPRALLGELAKSIASASNQPQCRVIVLESAGTGAFCAGASFDELLSIENVADGEKFFSGFADVILALNDAPQVTIARVQGKCAGGGVGLACATDYTLAVDSAAVRLSELAIGIGPFTIGPIVKRRIGPAAFSELALSSEWRDSAWCHRHGLFTEIFPDVASLGGRLHDLSVKFSTYPQRATQQVKRMVGDGFSESLETLLAKRVRAVSELVVTPEAQALIRAAKK